MRKTQVLPPPRQLNDALQMLDFPVSGAASTIAERVLRHIHNMGIRRLDISHRIPVSGPVLRRLQRCDDADIDLALDFNISRKVAYQQTIEPGLSSILIFDDRSCVVILENHPGGVPRQAMVPWPFLISLKDLTALQGKRKLFNNPTRTLRRDLRAITDLYQSKSWIVDETEYMIPWRVYGAKWFDKTNPHNGHAYVILVDAQERAAKLHKDVEIVQCCLSSPVLLRDGSFSAPDIHLLQTNLIDIKIRKILEAFYRPILAAFLDLSGPEQVAQGISTGTEDTQISGINLSVCAGDPGEMSAHEHLALIDRLNSLLAGREPRA